MRIMLGVLVLLGILGVTAVVIYLDYGTVEPCGPDGSCSDGFTCNAADHNCVTAFCIPDTNWAACPSNAMGCVVTPAAAAAGESLFLGILGGGPAAYSVAYTGPRSD